MGKQINKNIINIQNCISIFIMLIFPLINFSLTGCSSSKPAAPSNLEAKAVSSSQINLTWVDNAANEQGFKIERSEDQSNYTEIATADVDATAYSDTGLKPDATYYYRVLAYNIKGNSDYSNIAEAKTLPVMKTWEKILVGGSAGSIQQTKDGGYIIAGHQSHNLWVLKLDSDGNTVLDKKFLYPNSGGASSIQQTADGGYIIAGYSGRSLLILKLDSELNKEWEKIDEKYNEEYVDSIQQTSDKGYIVSSTISIESYTVPSHIRILKLDSSGEIVWEKIFFTGTYIVGTNYSSVQETLDGGYIVAGEKFREYLIDDNPEECSNMWIIKLDMNGNEEWDKEYGEMYFNEYASAIKQTKDGNYIVTGKNDLIKLNGNGDLVWSKKIGHFNYSIQQTKDDGFIIAGSTNTHGNDLADFWIGKIDNNGNLNWEKTYGGNNDDEAYSIQQTLDGGYVVAGYTKSFGSGLTDIWILKLNEYGNLK